MHCDQESMKWKQIGKITAYNYAITVFNMTRSKKNCITKKAPTSTNVKNQSMGYIKKRFACAGTEQDAKGIFPDLEMRLHGCFK